MKMLKRIILISITVFCLACSASAQINKSDCVKLKPKTDSTITAPGKLPGFFSQGNGKAKSDADFGMDNAPYRPDKSKQPLILVDGKKTSYKKLQKINVKNIKTIQILKDSTVVSKFGKKAHNGVLLVTTIKTDTISRQ